MKKRKFRKKPNQGYQNRAIWGQSHGTQPGRRRGAQRKSILPHLSVEVFARHPDAGEPEKCMVWAAFKNESTYIISTRNSGFKVIRNNVELYSYYRPREPRFTKLLYIDHLDCFFLRQLNRLYRKNIDDAPPQFYMDLESWNVDILTYSPANRILIARKSSQLAIIYLQSKRAEFKLDHTIFMIFDKFRLFGKNENRAVFSTHFGDIYFFNFNFRNRKLVSRTQHKIELIQDRIELVVSIAVSDDNEHLFCELHSGLRNCSRMMIFGIKNSLLVKKAVLDVSGQCLKSKRALSCCGGFEGLIFWVGIELDEPPGRGQLFCYDGERGRLVEFEEKRVGIKVGTKIYEFQRVGNSFFYLSQFGDILRLSVKY